MSPLEVHTSWKIILADFHQFEPLVSAYIDGTTLLKSQLADGKFVFTIEYPNYLAHQHQFLQSNPEILNKFKAYFADIVEEEHDVTISLNQEVTESDPSVETPLDLLTIQQKPEHAFKRDKEHEPLLEVLDSIFKFHFINSQKVIETKKDEVLDEYAEDA